jgi:hypothetical protein
MFQCAFNFHCALLGTKGFFMFMNYLYFAEILVQTFRFRQNVSLSIVFF